MSGWKDELTDQVDVGERMAEPPDTDEVRRGVRRRRAARVALPAGVAVAVIAAGVLVLPGLFRQPLDAAGPRSDACGQPVLDAAAAAFGAFQAVAAGEGLADVVAGANQVVEQGEGLAVGVGVRHGPVSVEEYALVPTGEDYVVGWLVQDDEIVGLLEPEFVAPPSGNVTPSSEVWVDGSYRLISCDGGDAPVGEYSIVAAVALTPVLDGDQTGEATAVLSAPIPLRIGEPDPLAGLGDCGSTWPEGVAETTDGYELGLRLDSDVAGVGATGAVALETEVAVSNVGTEELAGWTGHPHLVIVADGTVVGETGASTDEGIDASLAPGASIGYRASVPLTECGSDVLLATGTYEVYAIMSFFFESPAGQDGPQGTRTDVTGVGGPWTITID